MIHMRSRSIIRHAGCVLALLLNSCIALTGGVELRVIRADYPGGDNGTTYSSRDVDQYLAVVDRTARTYSFVKYEQNSSGTSTPLIHDSTNILISYRGNNGVIISVVSQKRNAFPFVSVQGNDTSFKLITETTDDILHGLRLQFPRANFNLEKNRTYGGF